MSCVKIKVYFNFDNFENLIINSSKAIMAQLGGHHESYLFYHNAQGLHVKLPGHDGSGV